MKALTTFVTPMLVTKAARGMRKPGLRKSSAACRGNRMSRPPPSRKVAAFLPPAASRSSFSFSIAAAADSDGGVGGRSCGGRGREARKNETRRETRNVARGQRREREREREKERERERERERARRG